MMKISTAIAITQVRVAQALGPPPALAPDAAGGGAVAGTSLTFAHVVSAASGYGILVVSLNYQDPAAGGSAPTGVTYAGRALTFLAGSQKATSTVITEKWYLLNPPAGTANVVVTCSGTLNIDASSSNWDGASQVTPFGTPVLNTGTGLAASATIAITAGNALLLSVVANGATQNVGLTPTGNLTTETSAQAGASPARTRGGGYYDTTVSGTATATVNLNLSKLWAASAVELKQAV